MTNLEKQELRNLAKQGLSFKVIRAIVDCSDGTIRQYIKTFKPEVRPKSDVLKREGEK